MAALNRDSVEAAIRPDTRMIAMLHASNVLGTILPVAEVGAIAKEHGIHFLVDAAQTAGAYPIDMAAMNIGLLAFSAHKGLLGPHGTGGLVDPAWHQAGDMDRGRVGGGIKTGEYAGESSIAPGSWNAKRGWHCWADGWSNLHTKPGG